ncbi:MAG: glycosyltransferase, partial [Chloroflexi bacterium]|nr:glycosyltransferase [Chloroflexota bacterium]
MFVTVVIPALNEAESIGRVLGEMPADAVDEVIVVDGGSTDDTTDIARAAG